MDRCHTHYMGNGDGGDENEDTSTYLGVNWKSRTDLRAENYYSPSSRTVYPGSGYVVDLPSDSKLMKQQLAELYENQWIDLSTRAVFLEFNLYNVPIQAFSSCRFVLELGAEGHFLTGRDIHVHNDYIDYEALRGNPVSADVYAHLIIELVLYCMIIFQLIFEVRELVTAARVYLLEDQMRRFKAFLAYHGEDIPDDDEADDLLDFFRQVESRNATNRGKAKRFIAVVKVIGNKMNNFKNGLQYVHLTLFIIAICGRCVTLYEFAAQIPAIESFVDSVCPDAEPIQPFFSLFFIQEWSKLSRSIFAFNCLIVFFKCAHYIRFYDRLALLVQTVKTASALMGSFMLIVSVTLTGFATVYHVAFGWALKEYRDLSSSFYSLTKITTLDFDYDRLGVVNPIFGQLLFFTYVVIVFFTIISMIFAVTNYSYNRSLSLVQADADRAHELDCVKEDFLHVYSRFLMKIYIFRRFLPSVNTVTSFCFEKADDSVLQAGFDENSYAIPDEDADFIQFIHTPRASFLRELEQLEARQRTLTQKIIQSLTNV